MTVDTPARTTLRALHEKGKSRYGSFFGRNSTFFSANWGGFGQYSGRNFHSLSNKSMSSKKVPPSKRMQISPG